MGSGTNKQRYTWTTHSVQITQNLCLTIAHNNDNTTCNNIKAHLNLNRSILIDLTILFLNFFEEISLFIFFIGRYFYHLLHYI